MITKQLNREYPTKSEACFIREKKEEEEKEKEKKKHNKGI